jgi:hypothetical protein
MAVKIYRLDESTLLFTEVTATTFGDPIAVGIRPGGTGFVKKLFLRNDDAAKWYDAIEIKPTSTAGADIVDGTVSIKLLSGDNKPTDAEWAAAPSNALATLASPLINGDTSTVPELGAVGSPDRIYYPFWIYVSMSKAAPIGTSQFSLQVTHTESNV